MLSNKYPVLTLSFTFYPLSQTVDLNLTFPAGPRAKTNYTLNLTFFHRPNRTSRILSAGISSPLRWDDKESFSSPLESLLLSVGIQLSSSSSSNTTTKNPIRISRYESDSTGLTSYFGESEAFFRRSVKILRAVSITPSMAHQLIQILKSKNVEFVVVPYEADAQLAYLSSLDVKQGGIEAVITEDSDLMAYGCKSVIFKMDKYGNGEEILMDKVFSAVTSTEENKKSVPSVPSFQNFDKELFTGTCVLAGCDFLPSITGIGIRRAYNLVSKYKNLDRVLSVLKFDKGNQIPEDYANSFKKAVAVFHHARVFDASTKTIKPMKPLPEELLKSLDGDLDFLGQYALVS